MEGETLGKVLVEDTATKQADFLAVLPLDELPKKPLDRQETIAMIVNTDPAQQSMSGQENTGLPCTAIRTVQSWNTSTPMGYRPSETTSTVSSTIRKDSGFTTLEPCKENSALHAVTTAYTTCCCDVVDNE